MKAKAIDPQKHFGRSIMFARLRQKKTLKQVARACGVALQTVHCWENGLHSPNIKSIARLAKVLRLSSSQMFDF